MADTATKPKVFVIDDQRLTADTLTAILNQNGFDAVAFYSGEEALESVIRSAPAIIMSDIRMHRIDGIQTALRIRTLHPRCRVILFSAAAVTETELHRIDESGFEFLWRPLHPTQVLHHLRTGAPGKNVLSTLPETSEAEESALKMTLADPSALSSGTQ
jgi:DNA-binding NtrC family response regulator